MAQFFRSFADDSVGAPANATEVWNAADSTFTVVAPATHGRGGSDNMLAVSQDTGNATYCALAIDDAPSAENMEVLIELYADSWNSNPPAVFPVVRASSTAGYVGSILGGGSEFYFGRIASSAEAAWNTGGTPGLTLNTTDAYRIRLRVNGTTVSVRMWRTADSEPGTWGHTWTDSNLSGSGAAAIGVRHQTGTHHVAWIGVGTAGDSAPDSAPSAATLSSPTGTATGQTTATIGCDTDDATGTLYGVVTTSATQPSATQVKAGQDHTGSAAAFDGTNASLSVGTNSIAATGLTAATTYYAHLVQDNGADSNVVSSASFTTDAATQAGFRITGIQAPDGSGIGNVDPVSVAIWNNAAAAHGAAADTVNAAGAIVSGTLELAHSGTIGNDVLVDIQYSTGDPAVLRTVRGVVTLIDLNA